MVRNHVSICSSSTFDGTDAVVVDEGSASAVRHATNVRAGEHVVNVDVSRREQNIVDRNGRDVVLTFRRVFRTNLVEVFRILHRQTICHGIVRQLIQGTVGTALVAAEQTPGTTGPTVNTRIEAVQIVCLVTALVVVSKDRHAQCKLL